MLVALAGLVMCSQVSFAERINHEGRILGPQPVVTEPILFNTPGADAIMSALQIFPTDNAWNEDISQRTVHSNSANIINTISSELLSSRRTLRAFYEMNFVLVPNDQLSVPIDFIYYPDESDPSPYPIPVNMPVPGKFILLKNPWQRPSVLIFLSRILWEAWLWISAEEPQRSLSLPCPAS